MANDVCRSILILVLIVSAVCSAFGQDNPNPSKNVWDGIYTSAQAERGREAFRIMCSGCHGADLSGGENPPLKGSIFLGHWVEDNLSALFAKMRQMPPRGDKPPESTHLEILAFLLESNDFPAGQKELNAMDVDGIRLTATADAGTVPDFA